MAVLWQRREQGKTYEVRQAGASLRLYTNGAFHSQYNPKHLFTYAVWDLLTLPVLFRQSTDDRVLMLGVGGGTAIHQLNNLTMPSQIVGIELDPVHIYLARRYFKVGKPNVELIEADAIAWLRQTRQTFDVIIDDIFVDAIGDPERPAPIDAAWLSRLAACTSAGGVVIQNHLAPRLARAMVSNHETLIREHFASALILTTPQYENGMLALYKEKVDAKSGRALAMEHINRISRSAARKLNFSCRQLF